MRGLFITPHAIERLRYHWKEARSYSDDRLIYELKKRIQCALDDHKRIKTPGGTYVPISLDGRDGFAVLHNLQVVTIQPVEFCQEIMEHGDFF